MIRKIIQRVNEWLEDRLRSLVRPLSPDARVIVIVAMLIVFSGLSIYMTVSSIYNLGKGKGEQMQIEQIETLKLQLEQQQRDSINNLNNHYQYERTTE
ncbi:MAG: TraL conjugative transposon family protein [Parachlamydiaceae bacterium]